MVSSSLDWILRTLIPAFGSIATVFLVGYYARLYKVNKEHLRSAQADYAPSLDVDVIPEEKRIGFEITNRGRGVAKNIELVAEFQLDGVVYRHRTYFDTTLRPDQTMVPEMEILGSDKNTPSAVYSDLRFCLPSSQDMTDTDSLYQLLDDVGGSDADETGFLDLRLEYTDVIEQNPYQEQVYYGNIRTNLESLTEIFDQNSRKGRIHDGKIDRRFANIRNELNHTVRRLSRFRNLGAQPNPYRESIDIQPTEAE